MSLKSQKAAFQSDALFCLRIDFTKLRQELAFGSMRFLLAHRFCQTPARACVWIDALFVGASILPNSGKSLRLDRCAFC